MKNLTWQNPEQLFVAQVLINQVKSKCCGIKDKQKSVSFHTDKRYLSQQKSYFFRLIRNIPVKFSFISINVNTFALNLNKITMNELNRIKVVLVEQKKTGKWLAEQLGVSVTTTSRWCSNSAQPDLQTLSKIAQLLKVDTRDLLTPLNKE